jgi:hypothetical protein
MWRQQGRGTTRRPGGRLRIDLERCAGNRGGLRRRRRLRLGVHRDERRGAKKNRRAQGDLVARLLSRNAGGQYEREQEPGDGDRKRSDSHFFSSAKAQRHFTAIPWEPAPEFWALLRDSPLGLLGGSLPNSMPATSGGCGHLSLRAATRNYRDLLVR